MIEPVNFYFYSCDFVRRIGWKKSSESLFDYLSRNSFSFIPPLTVYTNDVS